MISMRFEGGAELAATLRQLSTWLSRRLVQGALMEAGEPMRRSIASKAQRRPPLPDLADNVNLAPLRKQPGEDDVSVGIGVPKRHFYDWFLEYGTVNMRARPMYRPAFDSGVEQVLGTVGKALWRELAGRGIRPGVTQAPTDMGSLGRFL